MESRGRALILMPLCKDMRNVDFLRPDAETHYDLSLSLIAPASALVARVDTQGVLEARNGRIRVAYEGNVNEAVNITCFQDKARVAAGRLVQNYPSVAWAMIKPADIRIIAGMDLDRMLIDEIHDPAALASWSGERPDQIIPPKVPSGSDDPTDYRRLHALGGAILACPPMIFQMRNGQIFLQERRYTIGRIYDHDDPQLLEALDRHAIDPEIRRAAVGMPRG